MAKSTKTNPNPDKTRSSSSLKNVILIIPLIALIAITWLILIKLDMMPTGLTFGWEFETWKNFWLIILIILIIILILSIPRTGEHREADEAVIISTSETSKKTKKQVKAKPATMVTIEADDVDAEFVPSGKEKMEKEEKIEIQTSAAKSEPKVSGLSSKEVKEKVKSADIISPGTKAINVKPKVIIYPSEVEGGIYGDTFIEIDNDTVVKLRTLVVEDIYLL